MSVWDLLLVLLFSVVLPYFPASRILQRTGFNRWWVILYLIPVVNLVALYVFAYSEWPGGSKTEA